MLDQNTDRMWYVIGAVLVGAAIILIANGTIPEIFASVTDSFEGVSNSATNSITLMSDSFEVTSSMSQYNLLRNVSFDAGYFNYTNGNNSHAANEKNHQFRRARTSVAIEPNTEYVLYSDLNYDTDNKLEIAWTLFDETNTAIGGDNTYDRKSVRIVTPDDVRYIRVRFGYPVQPDINNHFDSPGFFLAKYSDVSSLGR